MTGIDAARAIKTILAISSNPNQREIIGIQASSAICFSPLNHVVKIRSAMRDRPSRSPTRTPTPEPSANPRRSRRRLAKSASTSSPLFDSSQKLMPTCSSGGRNWRFTRPEWLAISHRSSRPNGRTSPRPAARSAVLSDTVDPPTLQPGFDHRQCLVADKADDSDDDHGDQHGVEPEHLAPPYEEV